MEQHQYCNRAFCGAWPQPPPTPRDAEPGSPIMAGTPSSSVFSLLVAGQASETLLHGQEVQILRARLPAAHTVGFPVPEPRQETLSS